MAMSSAEFIRQYQSSTVTWTTGTSTATTGNVSIKNIVPSQIYAQKTEDEFDTIQEAEGYVPGDAITFYAPDKPSDTFTGIIQRIVVDTNDIVGFYLEEGRFRKPFFLDIWEIDE